VGTSRERLVVLRIDAGLEFGPDQFGSHLVFILTCSGGFLFADLCPTVEIARCVNRITNTGSL
jgi:hypothetical protein